MWGATVVNTSRELPMCGKSLRFLAMIAFVAAIAASVSSLKMSHFKPFNLAISGLLHTGTHTHARTMQCLNSWGLQAQCLNSWGLHVPNAMHACKHMHMHAVACKIALWRDHNPGSFVCSTCLQSPLSNPGYICIFCLRILHFVSSTRWSFSWGLLVACHKYRGLYRKAFVVRHSNTFALFQIQESATCGHAICPCESFRACLHKRWHFHASHVAGPWSPWFYTQTRCNAEL